MELQLVLVVIHILSIQGVWVDQGEELESPLQLLRQGKLSMGATYAHLQFPIKVSNVKKAFDDLEDVVEAYERYVLQGGAASAMRYSVNRLRSKISLIKGFVNPGQLHLALQEDTENKIEEVLTHRQSIKEKRSLASKVSPWVGLAGFGTSLYTSSQVSALKKEVDAQTSTQQVISQQMAFQSLRINNLTQYIHSYNGMVADAISKLTTGTRKAALEIHGRSMQLTLEVFKGEIKDFILGLTSLMQGKLHPLLIEPKRLSVAYSELLDKAKQEGLAPLVDDPSILFNCPTSTMASLDNGDLNIIVHVPFNTGYLNLYKFISAPIKLENQNSVTLSIDAKVEYLAIDAEQTKGGQYSADQISGCRTFQLVKHCPAINFLTRNLTSLCLYNVMMMQLDYNRQNCHILVSPIRQEIYSLGVNHYFLFSPTPTSISFDCASNRKQVKTFEGQLYLTMISDCPVAHTMGFTFSYTTNVLLKHDIVYLPTLYKIDKWFGDESLSSELEENTLSRMNELIEGGLSEFDNVRDGIPLNALIHQIHHRSETLLSWCLAILQHIMAVIAVIYFGFKFYLLVRLKISPIIRRYLPTCIRRGPTRYNSVPVLQNIPLRRIPKPGGRGVLSKTAPQPAGSTLSPV